VYEFLSHFSNCQFDAIFVNAVVLTYPPLGLNGKFNERVLTVFCSNEVVTNTCSFLPTYLFTAVMIKVQRVYSLAWLPVCIKRKG